MKLVEELPFKKLTPEKLVVLTAKLLMKATDNVSVINFCNDWISNKNRNLFKKLNIKSGINCNINIKDDQGNRVFTDVVSNDFSMVNTFLKLVYSYPKANENYLLEKEYLYTICACTLENIALKINIIKAIEDIYGK